MLLFNFTGYLENKILVHLKMFFKILSESFNHLEGYWRTSFLLIHICVTVIPILLLIGCIFVFLYRPTVNLFTQSLPTGVTKNMLEVNYSLRCIKRVIFLLSGCIILEGVNPVNWNRSFLIAEGLLVSNASTAFLTMVLLLSGLVFFYSLLKFVEQVKIPVYDLIAFALFLLFFCSLLIYCNNFLVFFIAIEGIAYSICINLAFCFEKSIISTSSTVVHPQNFYNNLYVFLIKSKNLFKNTITGSVIYFLLNIYISILFAILLSFSIFLYKTLDFMSIAGISNQLTGNTQTMLLVLGIVICFCFKFGLAPFHFWLPSVYTMASYFVIYLIAIPVKIVFVYIFFKILFGIFLKYSFIWGPLLLVIGLISIMIGSFGLSSQVEIKKFLAYSTLNHFGTMIMALGTETFFGEQAFLGYFIIYNLMTIGFLFFIIALIRTDTQQTLSTFSEFLNISAQNKLLQWCFAIILLSMAGLPPLLGFWGKFFVFNSLLGLNSMVGNFLIICLLIFTVLAAYSYLNIFNLIFFQQTNKICNYYSFLPVSQWFIIGLVMVCLVLVFGGCCIFNNNLFELFETFTILFWTHGFSFHK
jgi:NADH-quinone oxidoreductase subunit N